MVRQARSEATRRKIITSAVELFNEIGYPATGLGDIIDRAEMTKGALYYHFDSKESLATAIIDVAGLGFLGLGPQDPSTPEWGTMLTDTTRYLQTAPFLALIPGAAIVISVLGFNLIGDGLREALDPRFRGRA